MFRQLLRLKNSYFSKRRAYSAKLFTNSMTRFIRVNAIDHDNCFGVQYMQPVHVQSVHAPVLDYLKAMKIKHEYSVDYVMSSSNRQSIYLDCLNATHNQNNLAFPVAIAVAKHLDAWFDPLLLADITANRKPGFHIQYMKTYITSRGLNFTKDDLTSLDLKDLLNEKHAGYIFSEDKVNIIYAQMHRMALMYPDAVIHYDVYDDLLEQVIYALKKFYDKYPELIPHNVKLSLNHFESDNSHELACSSLNVPIRLHEVTGTGDIDANYYDTVKIMGDIARDEEGNKNKYQIAKYITPDRIKKELLQHRLK